MKYLNTHTNESRLSLDELETLTPENLLNLLYNAIIENRCNLHYVKDILAVGCPIRNSCNITLLHMATAWGRLDIAELSIDMGLDVNEGNDIGNSPLFAAVSCGYTEIVKFLISKGADIHAKDNYGKTSLHLSTYFVNRDEIVNLLISHGADKNIKDNSGQTAWDYASNVIRESIPELNPLIE